MSSSTVVHRCPSVQIMALVLLYTIYSPICTQKNSACFLLHATYAFLLVHAQFPTHTHYARSVVAVSSPDHFLQLRSFVYVFTAPRVQYLYGYVISLAPHTHSSWTHSLQKLRVRNHNPTSCPRHHSTKKLTRNEFVTGLDTRFLYTSTTRYSESYTFTSLR